MQRKEGEATKFFAQQMWLLVPIQGQVTELFSDFADFPYQDGSSLNAGNINYTLLKRTEALERLKQPEVMRTPG